MAKKTRLPNEDIEFYENNIARQNKINREIRGIVLDVTDPDILALIMTRLANIQRHANETRNELITHRDKQQNKPDSP